VLLTLAEHLVRTALLLALTIAPTALSPEPPPSGNPAFFGLLSAMGLAALVYGAVAFARHVDTTRARVAAALVGIAVVLALIVERIYSGDGAPLARGVPAMAIPVWGALAALASTAGEQWLGSNWKHRTMAPIVVALGAGALQIGGASKLLGAPDKMWWSALKRDADHPRALAALVAAARPGHKNDDVRGIAARCITMHPNHCPCLELHASSLIAAKNGDKALAAARTAAERCPKGNARAILAEALVMTGDAMAAELEARRALADGAPEARLRYALGLALDRQGRYPDAAEEARRAIELGAGRDAQLFAGALAIAMNDLDAAERSLRPLVAADPGDAQARYDLALVADKRGDYNGAREGYIAALEADPSLADARYNLAVLTFRHGVVDEARHHVKKLAETSPKDPRLPELAKLTGATLR